MRKKISIMKQLKQATAYHSLNIFCMLLFVVVCMIGLRCNFAVITENGGKMPVLLDKEYNVTFPEHFFFTEFSEVHHPYLADIFGPVNDEYFWRFSIGDVLQLTGAAGVWYNGLRILRRDYLRRKRKKVHKLHKISVKGGGGGL